MIFKKQKKTYLELFLGDERLLQIPEGRHDELRVSPELGELESQTELKSSKSPQKDLCFFWTLRSPKKESCLPISREFRCTPRVVFYPE